MVSIPESSGENGVQVSPLPMSTPTSRLISKRSYCLFVFKIKNGSDGLLSEKKQRHLALMWTARLWRSASA